MATGTALILGVGAAALVAKASNKSRLACNTYVVLDVHGSDGEANQGSPAGASFVQELGKYWPPSETDVKTVPFKAAGGSPTLVAAALKLPVLYYPSLVKIKDWVRNTVLELSGACPDTKLFLVGYSQGAQAVGDVYQERPWPTVVGVVLFGDPLYNHADSSDRFGLNIKANRRIKTKLDGALAAPHARKPFNNSKVLSFCHQEDLFCQAPLSRYELMLFKTKEHKNYEKFGEPAMAAQYFAQPVSKTPPRVINNWPVNRHEGSTGFLMYLGATYLAIPDWSSCNSNYCLVGMGEVVYVYSITGEIKPVGTITKSTDPRGDLSKLGLSQPDIDSLLQP